jgi:hypothetical protein
LTVVEVRREDGVEDERADCLLVTGEEEGKEEKK